MIEPKRDAYGPDADTSHLADYLELLALAGKPLKRAELADYLADSDWVVRSRELIFDPSTTFDEPSEDEESGGPQVSPSEVAADDVFAFVAERSDSLGERYPFVVQNSTVAMRDAHPEHDAYLALLSITAAHHYAVETPVKVERVFERLVASVMADRGLLSTDTGQLGREPGDFRALIQRVGDKIDLPAVPDAVPSRTYANEEGVDTVSHFEWGDRRAGHWIFLGQATCARSNEWARKIKEPDPKQWGPLLGSVVEPIPYLAVPHHVESAHLMNVTQSTGRLILDRLRIAKYLEDVEGETLGVLDVIRKQPVFSPTD